MMTAFFFIVAVLLHLALPASSFQQRPPLNTSTKKPLAASTTDGNKEKRPWEFFRFVRTAGFFNAFRPSFLKRSATSQGVDAVRPGTVLWSPSGTNGIEWGPLDDVVMGGASRTELAPGGTFDGVWRGVVTTANNGGFAGIRTKLLSPVRDASQCTGMRLKVKGDGQRFKLILRDDADWNGTAWSVSFDTAAGRTTEVKIPFRNLKATRFARSFDAGRPYNAKQLTAVQLTLSKFEYDGGLNPSFREGPFRLEIEEIGFY